MRRPSMRKQKTTVPPPDHIVVVIFENKHRASVMASGQAPYLDKLADRGANLTRSYGITHPSQPNYLALFSGSTHGVTGMDVPRTLARPTTWAISSVSQASALSAMLSPCRILASAAADRVATSANTTRGSTSAHCQQAPTALSATFPATTAGCPLWRS